MDARDRAGEAAMAPGRHIGASSGDIQPQPSTGCRPRASLKLAVRVPSPHPAARSWVASALGMKPGPDVLTLGRPRRAPGEAEIASKGHERIWRGVSARTEGTLVTYRDCHAKECPFKRIRTRLRGIA
jgi:hypothetical protein